jgi:hypothetical protein
VILANATIARNGIRQKKREPSAQAKAAKKLRAAN